MWAQTALFQVQVAAMPCAAGPTILGNTIAFGPIASTKKACTPSVMDQETKFFFALRDARKWRIDPVRRKLLLLDGNKNPVVAFGRM
jgi:putative lipoprotein